MMQTVVGLSLEAAPFSLSVGAGSSPVNQQQQVGCTGMVQGQSVKDYRSEVVTKKGHHTQVSFKLDLHAILGGQD